MLPDRVVVRSTDSIGRVSKGPARAEPQQPKVVLCKTRKFTEIFGYAAARRLSASRSKPMDAQPAELAFLGAAG